MCVHCYMSITFYAYKHSMYDFRLKILCKQERIEPVYSILLQFYMLTFEVLYSIVFDKRKIYWNTVQ